MSAHKEVSLDSILPQVSTGSQDQAKDKVAPQSSGVSAGSNVSSKLQDHASDRGAPQSSVGSVWLQVSSELQNQTSNQTMQRSNQESNQCPNKMPAFPLELMSIIKEIRGQLVIQPVCKSHERKAVTSKSDQTSQGSPPFSKFTLASMPPIPKHKYVEPPLGRPPIAWSKIINNSASEASPSGDGVRPQSSGVSGQSNQQSAYKKIKFDCVSAQANGVSAHK